MAFPADFQEKTRDAYGVTYASVANPDTTVRVKVNPSPKVLAGQSVKNYVSEIIFNENNDILIGTSPNQVAAVDPLSVRIKVSGTNESMARLKEILTGLRISSPVWETDNYLIGFVPSVNPGSAT